MGHVSRWRHHRPRRHIARQFFEAVVDRKAHRRQAVKVIIAIDLSFNELSFTLHRENPTYTIQKHS